MCVYLEVEPYLDEADTGHHHPLPLTHGPARRCTSAEKWSASNTVLCIVSLNARVILNALIVLD